MNKKALGKRIRQARSNVGMSPQTLCDLVGLSSDTYVMQLERGEKTPKVETLVKIANALKISADNLLCDSLNIKVASMDDDLCGRIQNLSSDYQRFVLALVDEMTTRMTEIKNLEEEIEQE